VTTAAVLSIFILLLINNRTENKQQLKLKNMFRPIVTDNFEIIRATSPAHFGHTILDDPLAILLTFIILLTYPSI